MNASAPGTVIIVADGTYTENLTISVSGITLLSENGRGAVAINGSAGTLGTILYADANGGTLTLTLTTHVMNVEVVAASQVGSLDNVAMNIDASAIANGVTVTGNAAANILTGTAFADIVSGYDGDDAPTGGADNDALNGGDGNDTLQGGTNNDTLNGGAGADILNGGSGVDTVSYETSSAAVSVNLLLGTATGGDAAGDTLALIENLTGSGYGDNLSGDNTAQTLIGNAGGNMLSGLGGDDWLRGFAGNDTLDGGAGVDSMSGGAGNDLYLVDNANDVVVETAGGGGLDRVLAKVSYTLAAGSQIEALGTTLTGGTADINLMGNELAQRLTGNAGANVLNGLGGNDVLTGNAGADSFAFSTTLGAGNVEVVTDFSVADDTMLLAASAFSGLASGVLAADAFIANETGEASDALQRIIYETNTGKVWFDVDGMGGATACCLPRSRLNWLSRMPISSCSKYLSRDLCRPTLLCWSAQTNREIPLFPKPGTASQR